MVLGVSAIKGLAYLKTHKEKREMATFTFWTHFRIRVMEIERWLNNDYNLINYFFDENSRSTWESESGDDELRLQFFKGIVEETIQFMKKTPDQMPAYIGWSDDYTEFMLFLNDIIQFDICNGEDYFKFQKEGNTEKRDEYCKRICEIMNRICDGILDEQRKIEEGICS